jgi:hypothetical protein
MVIKKELLLDVEIKKIYDDMSDVNFFNKILDENNKFNILYKKDRLIEYELNINGVGKWISRRILLPEKAMFITERKSPSDPFEYMVILNIYEKYGNITKFIYKEEFEISKDNKEKKDEIYNNISCVVNKNMEILVKYYGIVKESVE